MTTTAAAARRTVTPTGQKGGPVKVWLLMQVERDAEGRFDGEILHLSRGTLAGFSGTPQMLAVMEDIIPAQRPILEVGELTGPGSAPGPAGG